MTAVVSEPPVDQPPITIRAVGPHDADIVGQLFDGLDEQSRYRRWFTGAVDLTRATQWAAHPERTESTGLLAFVGGEVVGHGVLVPDGKRAEVAFEVAAPWRHHGVATALLEALLSEAAARGVEEVYASVLRENVDMLAVLVDHGGRTTSTDGSTSSVTLDVAT